ncbi:MAG: hypothetical protein M1832_001276 [Thelocarpon impressellum]|nr:MAG: hypothetical protein M1832_001276 [Thelocarpon impressellum]
MAGRPMPRPKRAGESFARTHHLDDGDDDDGPSSSKKPRFDVRNPSALAPDAPEDDAILDMDEIGKAGQHTKRSAVNLDGYESDSSNEGFDARAETRAKQGKASKNEKAETDVDDTNDMFAELEEDLKDSDAEDEPTGTKPKKGVRFLDEDEIEGQVGSSKAGGHVSADFDPHGKGKGTQREAGSDSDTDSDAPANADTADVDEEVGAGGRKAHAPKLDAFNMKSEMDEGRFDAAGNFVRKAADPQAVHDSWLEGVSRKDMKRAREAADKREQERRDRAVAADRVLTSDILSALISRLERTETVLEALARLGRGGERTKKKPKWQQKRSKRRRDGMDVDDADAPATDDPAEALRREAVEAVTEAADALLTRGQMDIYDATREQLMRQYARETGEDWVDPPRRSPSPTANGTVTEDPEINDWEYRWTDGRDGGAAHGPYDGATMMAWVDAGFFGDGVEFRAVGSRAEWSRSVDFV